MNDEKSLITTDDKKLDLSKMHEINLENLNEEQRQNISGKFADAQLELVKKAQQAQIDLGATKQGLDDFANTVKTSTAEGTSTTITHTQTTSVGRTEIVMGNTEKAAKGTISRSGAGLTDNSLKIIVIIAIAVVFAIIFAGN
jgi:hypothetical protein